LYADALLCFHLDGIEDAGDRDGQKPLDPPEKRHIGFVPRRIYAMQSKWYHNVRQKYGLPLDSRHLYTKTDWEFFAMAVSNRSVRHEILDSVALWLNETVTDRPFTDLHNTEGDGGFPGPNFFARPVVGGHFAFLALERACGGRAMEGLAFLNDGMLEEPGRCHEGELPDYDDGGYEDYYMNPSPGGDTTQVRIGINLPSEDDSWAGPGNKRM
jgi:hypothetical protein